MPLRFGLRLTLTGGGRAPTLAAPVNVTVPTIDDTTPAVTQVLTASVGSWSGYPSPTFAYEWQQDTAGNGIFAAIGGATSSTYTVGAGTLGNALRVKVTATNSQGSANANSAATSVVVAADTTPAAFSFTDVTDATTNTVYTSNAITVSGINLPATITVTGGEYSINGGTYTSGAGSVVNGDTVTARGTSSGSASTAVNVAVTIGGVSDTYTITTAAGGGGGTAGEPIGLLLILTKAA